MTTKDKLNYLFEKYDGVNSIEYRIAHIVNTMYNRNILKEEINNKIRKLYQGGYRKGMEFRSSDILIIELLYKIDKNYENGKINGGDLTNP